MKLRPYQEEAVESIYRYFEAKSGNPILVLPTASGKSIILAEFIHRVIDHKGQRILCLTHVRELIEQNAEKIRLFCPGLNLGIHSAGLNRRDLSNQVIVAGIQSIYTKAHELGPVSLVIVDECHLIPPKGQGRYKTFLSNLKHLNPKLKVIGLSATPYRLGTGMLHKGKDALFTDIAYEIGVKRLISEEYLSPVISKVGKTEANLKGVATKGGDYVLSSLQDAVNHQPLIDAAVDEVIKLAPDRKKWLVFCAGIDHVRAVSETLSARGIKTRYVTGKTPSKERKDTLGALQRGEIQALVNMGVLTTGFDCPGIDLIVMLRPTQSPGLYVQMTGRGMRLAEGKKDCLILDFAGNIMRHGPIDIVDTGLGAGDGYGEEGEAPVRMCPECRTVMSISRPQCFECGFVFPIEDIPPHDEKPTLADIISPDLKVKTFNIVSTEYARHKKPGKPDSMIVTYRVNMLQSYSEWVCFEHGGYAQAQARLWWYASVGSNECDVPEDVTEAISRSKSLRTVSKIQVSTFGKYPKILGRKFKPR